MNKYTELSDFEINKKVAEKIHGKGGVSRTFEDVIIFKDSGVEKFDPCNTPSDAMPIVIENGISSTFNNGEWICTISNGEILSFSENLYRTAMEVYLLMKDAENENNNNS